VRVHLKLSLRDFCVFDSVGSDGDSSCQSIMSSDGPVSPSMSSVFFVFDLKKLLYMVA